MADVQLDVASANRFISSLSKSLQALCHGCMDFDAGIEIVGYLNINIDSGSKVDYVLNEKVLKSTTNSMTFVSNSFLAKKDQPKHLADGSCSPIPELNYPQHRTRGGYSYPAAQQYRSSGIFSPHSQVLRGSQKRAWSGGDWRTSPRKFPRGAKSQHGSYQHQTSSQSDSYPYSNQSPADDGLPLSFQESTFTSQDYEGSGTQGEINVKKEPDGNTDESLGYNQSVSGGESNNQNSALSDGVNIKTDPDSLPNQEGSNENADMSNSFLQPTKTDETSEKDPNGAEDNQESTDTKYEDPSFNAAEEPSVAEEDHENPDMSNTNDDSQGLSGADADYEGTGEMYPQSSYAGEGSSSGGGQFEVIEIDDEDEDVAAMFDDSRSASAFRGSRSWTFPNSGYPNNFVAPSESEKCNFMYMEIGDGQKIPYCYTYMNNHDVVFCMECGRNYRSASGVRAHFKIKHCGTFDYHCDICGKGFQQQSHLKCHMAMHSHQKQFVCAVCGSKYAHKTSLTSHIKLAHNGQIPADS